MVRYLPSLSECPLSYKLRRDGRLASGHFRTRSYPSHRPKRTYCKNCSGADSSSFMHCTPKPPANKKLCSSLSLPDNESSERQLSWVPRASSVWQPVDHSVQREICGRCTCCVNESSFGLIDYFEWPLAAFRHRNLSTVKAWKSVVQEKTFSETVA